MATAVEHAIGSDPATIEHLENLTPASENELQSLELDSSTIESPAPAADLKDSIPQLSEANEVSVSHLQLAPSPSELGSIVNEDSSQHIPPFESKNTTLHEAQVLSLKTRDSVNPLPSTTQREPTEHESHSSPALILADEVPTLSGTQEQSNNEEEHLPQSTPSRSENLDHVVAPISQQIPLQVEHQNDESANPSISLPATNEHLEPKSSEGSQPTFSPSTENLEHVQSNLEHETPISKSSSPTGPVDSLESGEEELSNPALLPLHSESHESQTPALESGDGEHPQSILSPISTQNEDGQESENPTPESSQGEDFRSAPVPLSVESLQSHESEIHTLSSGDGEDHESPPVAIPVESAQSHGSVDIALQSGEGGHSHSVSTSFDVESSESHENEAPALEYDEFAHPQDVPISLPSESHQVLDSEKEEITPIQTFPSHSEEVHDSEENQHQPAQALSLDSQGIHDVQSAQILPNENQEPQIGSDNDNLTQISPSSATLEVTQTEQLSSPTERPEILDGEKDQQPTKTSPLSEGQEIKETEKSPSLSEIPDTIQSEQVSSPSERLDVLQSNQDQCQSTLIPSSEVLKSEAGQEQPTPIESNEIPASQKYQPQSTQTESVKVSETESDETQPTHVECLENSTIEKTSFPSEVLQTKEQVQSTQSESPEFLERVKASSPSELLEGEVEHAKSIPVLGASSEPINGSLKMGESLSSSSPILTEPLESDQLGGTESSQPIRPTSPKIELNHLGDVQTVPSLSTPEIRSESEINENQVPLRSEPTPKEVLELSPNQTLEMTQHTQSESSHDTTVSPSAQGLTREQDDNSTSEPLHQDSSDPTQPIGHVEDIPVLPGTSDDQEHLESQEGAHESIVSSSEPGVQEQTPATNEHSSPSDALSIRYPEIINREVPESTPSGPLLDRQEVPLAEKSPEIPLSNLTSDTQPLEPRSENHVPTTTSSPEQSELEEHNFVQPPESLPSNTHDQIQPTSEQLLEGSTLTLEKSETGHINSEPLPHSIPEAKEKPTPLKTDPEVALELSSNISHSDLATDNARSILAPSDVPTNLEPVSHDSHDTTKQPESDNDVHIVLPTSGITQNSDSVASPHLFLSSNTDSEAVPDCVNDDAQQPPSSDVKAPQQTQFIESIETPLPHEALKTASAHAQPSEQDSLHIPNTDVVTASEPAPTPTHKGDSHPLASSEKQHISQDGDVGKDDGPSILPVDQGTESHTVQDPETQDKLNDDQTTTQTEITHGIKKDDNGVETHNTTETTTFTEKIAGFAGNVEDTMQIVGKEVSLGAQRLVESVESHPELIAEGALAVVVGAASLVQPELIGAEVALIGKMASDAAKKNALKIAGDEAQKIVKAIAHDVKQDQKSASEDVSDMAKDSSEAIAIVKTDIGVSQLVHEPTQHDKSANVDTKADEQKSIQAPPHSGDHVISLVLSQETAEIKDGTVGSSTPPPVSVKITIGSDGTVQAVTQSVTVDPTLITSTEEVAPKVDDKPLNVVSTEIPNAATLSAQLQTPLEDAAISISHEHAESSTPSAPVHQIDSVTNNSDPAAAPPEVIGAVVESAPIESEPVLTETAVTEPPDSELIVSDTAVLEQVKSHPVESESVVSEHAAPESNKSEPVLTEIAIPEPVQSDPILAERAGTQAIGPSASLEEPKNEDIVPVIVAASSEHSFESEPVHEAPEPVVPQISEPIVQTEPIAAKKISPVPAEVKTEAQEQLEPESAGKSAAESPEPVVQSSEPFVESYAPVESLPRKEEEVLPESSESIPVKEEVQSSDVTPVPQDFTPNFVEPAPAQEVSEPRVPTKEEESPKLSPSEQTVLPETPEQTPQPIEKKEEAGATPAGKQPVSKEREVIESIPAVSERPEVVKSTPVVSKEPELVEPAQDLSVQEIAKAIEIPAVQEVAKPVEIPATSEPEPAVATTSSTSKAVAPVSGPVGEQNVSEPSTLTTESSFVSMQETRDHIDTAIDNPAQATSHSKAPVLGAAESFKTAEPLVTPVATTVPESPAVVEHVKPSETVPTPTEQTPPPIQTKAAEPAPKKRSVLGSISKIFWLFGSSKSKDSDSKASSTNGNTTPA